MAEHAPTYDELLVRIAHLEAQRRAAQEVVAERDRAAAELHRSERRFRSLAEEVPNIAVQGYDRERRVIYWNAASEALYGFSREEATGRRLEDLIIPGPMKAPVVAGIEAWLTRGEPIPAGELVLRKKDGSPVNVFSSHVMVEGAGGEPEMFCLDVDLTGRRALEDQLRASQRMEVVGRLAGGIAHDFNNLLTIILTCAEALQEDARAGHPVADDVGQIQAAARRATDLTRQLLAFARKQVASPVPLDLNAVLHRSETLLRRALGEAVELAIAPGPGLWNVRLDPGQLEQVILNLAVNARDAMPGGGRLLLATANAHVEDALAVAYPWIRPGPHVRLTVRDTGVGMSAEVKAHIFEPFFTTKPAGHGTGLGLATVYGIVKQSEGHILVHSAPGKGTSFELFFPRTLEDAAAESPMNVPARPSRGTETVLVVEDDPQVREVTTRALRDGGHRVLAAPGGPEAVAIAPGDLAQTKLVVCDVILPGLDGPAVVRELRRLSPGLRVLYVSGYTHGDMAERGVLDPPPTYLQKPFTASSLLARVREVLEAPGALAEGRPQGMAGTV